MNYSREELNQHLNDAVTGWERDNARLRADLARALPVVEAALRVSASFDNPYQGGGDLFTELDALARAVRAARERTGEGT